MKKGNGVSRVLYSIPFGGQFLPVFNSRALSNVFIGLYSRLRFTHTHTMRENTVYSLIVGSSSSVAHLHMGVGED